MAEARNLVAHQSPTDPIRQALVFERVLAVLPQVMEIFDALSTDAELYLPHAYGESRSSS